jgi:hypothetical protein
MAMKPKSLLFAISVVFVGGTVVGGAVLLGRGRHHTQVAAADDSGDVAPPAQAAEPEPLPVPKPPVAAEPYRRRPPAAPSPPTEASLMSALHDLGASDPARALELAREGNRQFPNGPDAAERSSTVCKSLAALGRFSEAQAAARQMVERYPGTTWAEDVKRHLLTQPLNDPSQRGYGKSSELD